MKKKTLFLMIAVIAGTWLAGCGEKQTVFSPTDPCIYVAEDGGLFSALVESYEGTIELGEVKEYLEEIISSYNEEHGAGKRAEPKSGTENRLPVALAKLEKTDQVIKAVFEYASIEDLIQFRQTEENEDDSNSISKMQRKPVAEATDWFLAENFTKADGTRASLEELKKASEGTAVYLEGGGTIRFAGTVLFLALDAEKKDEYTVTVPDGGKAYVVFK